MPKSTQAERLTYKNNTWNQTVTVIDILTGFLRGTLSVTWDYDTGSLLY